MVVDSSECSMPFALYTDISHQLLIDYGPFRFHLLFSERDFMHFERERRA